MEQDYLEQKINTQTEAYTKFTETLTKIHVILENTAREQGHSSSLCAENINELVSESKEMIHELKDINSLLLQDSKKISEVIVSLEEKRTYLQNKIEQQIIPFLENIKKEDTLLLENINKILLHVQDMGTIIKDSSVNIGKINGFVEQTKIAHSKLFSYLSAIIVVITFLATLIGLNIINIKWFVK